MTVMTNSNSVFIKDSISSARQKEKRRIWATTRSILEIDNYKHKRYGKKSKSHWTLFEYLVHKFGVLLKILNLFGPGYNNAKNIVVKEVEVCFKDLPQAFHGYKILHLSDLHFGCIEGIEDIICEKVKDYKYDLVVFTGDYRADTHGGIKHVLKPMEKVIGALDAKDGLLAVLGNHDSYLMVDKFEDMGLRVLTNETVFIQREDEQISFTGVDDPYSYYTDQAFSALEEEIDCFKVALVHSSELHDVAADNGYCLYLCGHTHGGQICFPNGVPLITHSYDGRDLIRGLWQYSKMQGYTSQGCGASGIPIRFFTESEITLFHLKGE